MLHLRILSAHSLTNADSGLLGDVSDPYAVARLGTEERKTGVVANSLNPIWQEDNSFSFEVPDSSRILEIEVLNSNTLLKDQSLGLVFVDFRELKPSSWHRRLERLSGGPNSDLEFDIRFDPAPKGGLGQQPEAAAAEHDGVPSIADGGDDAMWQDLAEQSSLVASNNAGAGGEGASAHAHQVQGGGISGGLGGGLGSLRRSTSAGARLRKLAEEIWEHRQEALPLRRASSSDRGPQQQSAGTHASGTAGSSRPSSARAASERQCSATHRSTGGGGATHGIGKQPSDGATSTQFNAQECLEKLHNTSCDSLLQQSCLTPSTSVNPMDRDWNKRSCGSLGSSAGSCPATPVLMRSRKLLWQRLEREVEWAFDAVAGDSGVLKYEMLSGFLARMGCLPPEPPFDATELSSGTCGSTAGPPGDDSSPIAPATARVRRASSPATSSGASGGGNQGAVAATRARSASPGQRSSSRVQRSTAVMSQQRNRCLRLLWQWLDPDDTGSVDLLTMTMCFHTLFGSAGEVAGEMQELAEGEGGEEFQRVAGLLKRFDNPQLRSDLRELVFYRMKHQPQSSSSRHQSQETLVQPSPRPLSPKTQELAARATQRRRMAAQDVDGTASHSDLLQCWGRKLREALDIKRHLRSSQELDGCTFHPQTCHSSASSTQQPKSQSPKRGTSAEAVFDSLYGNAKTRQQTILNKRAEAVQKVSDEEAKTCTFRPDVRKSASSRKLAAPRSYPHGFTETRSRLLTGAGQRREEWCMKEERVARLRSLDRERFERAGWTYGAAGPFSSYAQHTNCRGSTPPPTRPGVSPTRPASPAPKGSPRERQAKSPRSPTAAECKQEQPQQQQLPRPRLFHKQQLIDEYHSRQERQFTQRMMQYPPLQQYQPQKLQQHPQKEPPQQQQQPRQAQPEAPPLSARQRQRQAQQELYQQQKQQLKQQLEEHHAVLVGRGRQGSPKAAADGTSSLLSTPLFKVEVRIDPNRPPVHLVFREGNCVADVAAEFAVRHALGPKQAQRLFHMLESQVRQMTR